MKKSLLISLLIHCLIVFSLLYKKTIDKEIEKELELTQTSMYEIEIIELADSFSEVDQQPELKNYYWGIGVTQDLNNKMIINGIETYGVLVLKVVPGYNG